MIFPINFLRYTFVCSMLLFVSVVSVTYAMPISNFQWVEINGNGVVDNSLYWNGGVNNARSVIAYSKGYLYVGGSFKKAGNCAVNGIARWDGKEWNALNGGISGFYNINTLVTDVAGNVYATADVNTYDKYGFPKCTLAKWNGKSWNTIIQPFYPDYTSWGWAMCCDSTNILYMAGGYDELTTDHRSSISKYSNGKWSTLGAGITGSILSLCIDKNHNLYAGGEFDSAGGKCIYSLAKWNGTEWSPIEPVSSDSSRYVSALATDDSCNLFICSNSMDSTFILKWNGIEWSTCFSEKLNQSYTMQFNNDGNLYVATRNEVRKYNGKTWNTVGAPIGYEIRSMSVANSNSIFVGGSFGKYGNSETDINQIAVWDGNRWARPDPKRINGIVEAICSNDGNVYVGGKFTMKDNIPTNHIAVWNGLQWKTLGSGLVSKIGSSTTVKAITRAGKDTLIVAGVFDSAGGIAAKNIAKWDGSKWDSLGSGLNRISEYNALVYDNKGIVYVGGQFDSAGGVSVNHIAMWDGSKWSSLGSGVRGIEGSGVTSIAVDKSGNIYAGGSFDSAGNVAAKGIAKWNGSMWSALGTENFSRVSSLTFDSSGNLYVADNISNKCNISKWDGQIWKKIDSIPIKTGLVNSILTDKAGNIYAAGAFDTGTDSVKYLLIWDGKNWANCAHGTDSNITCMSILDSIIYIGGSFLNAGNSYSPYIAKANNTIYPIRSRYSEKTVPGNKQISYVIKKSIIHFSNISENDKITIYSIRGNILRIATSTSDINLEGIAPQPLLIRVSKLGKSVSIIKLLWNKY